MRSNHPLLQEDHFKIGIFSANCSGGLAATTVPERWNAGWDENLALALAADELGIDFMLPIARFTGYGGAADFQGHSLETLVWATGLLAATRRLTCFATVHTSFSHPVLAAKQFATADHVGHGRFGLNIVAGWNQPEYEMFGVELPEEHSKRYARAEEWWGVVNRIWQTSETFDWDGKYFKLKNVQGLPKPFDGVPPILNAASSAEGLQFAAANADFLFTVMTDFDRARAAVANLRKLAEAEARRVGILTTCYVVCRPTQKEADDYHRHYAETFADGPGVERLMELQGSHAKSFPPDAFEQFRMRFAGGHGSYPLVGDPDYVAGELARIASAGFDGTTVAFVDYTSELPYFAAEVFPRLEQKGLRQPAASC